MSMVPGPGVNQMRSRVNGMGWASIALTSISASIETTKTRRITSLCPCLGRARTREGRDAVASRPSLATWRRGSADHGGTADCDHQHAVVLAEDFVIQVDADHRVGTEVLRALRHLRHRNLARLGQP